MASFLPLRPKFWLDLGLCGMTTTYQFRAGSGYWPNMGSLVIGWHIDGRLSSYARAHFSTCLYPVLGDVTQRLETYPAWS